MSQQVILSEILEKRAARSVDKNLERHIAYYELGQKFQKICEQNPSIPPDKMHGLEKNAVPHPIEPRSYLALHDHLSSQIENSRLLNEHTYAAYLLFGSVEKLEHFAKRCCKLNETESNAAQILSCIEFPPAREWDKIQFRLWGDAFCQRGNKETNPFFLRLAKDTIPLRNRVGHVSFVMTEFTVMSAPHKKDAVIKAKIDKLMDLSMVFKKNTKEFGRALKAFTDEKEEFAVPEGLALPPLMIDGRKFGLPRYVFKRIERDDPRLLYMGDQTNSCERVTDAANSLERTIVQACKSSTHGFYIVEEIGTKKIVADSWAWRGKHQELVFDGFESNEFFFNRGHLSMLLPEIIRAAESVDFDVYDINGIFVGVCAKHLQDHAFLDHIDHLSIMPQEIKGVGMKQGSLSMIAKPYDQSLDYMKGPV